MRHELDKDIVMLEQRLSTIADEISDVIDEWVALPEDERPEIGNLEEIMNFIRESL